MRHASILFLPVFLAACSSPEPIPCDAVVHGDYRTKAIADEVQKRINAVQYNEDPIGDVEPAAWAKEWAGMYGISGWVGYTISLSASNQFAVLWSSCLVEHANYGEVLRTFPDGVEVSLKIPRCDGATTSRLYFVRWGDRRYLIPEQSMDYVVNQFNAAGGPCKPFMPVRWEDRDRPVFGFPDLPLPWASRLRESPIVAEVVSVHEEIDEDAASSNGDDSRVVVLELNVGSDAGLCQNAWLFRADESPSDDLIWIRSIQSNSAQALVYPSRNPAPAPGAVLTNRSQYVRADDLY